MSQEEFNKAYYASLPPVLTALIAMGNFQERSNQGAVLALTGYVVDVPIMIWGWDPYWVMTLRQQYNNRFVPDASGTKQIKVSVDPADFPAYVIPVVDPLAEQAPTPKFPAPPAGKVAVLTPFGWSVVG